ncbi:MAG TPA: hypothetical protein VK184_24580 [Nostocaceae cyanobacterium]|nr:hypothetical protein [Nostocaceae cyanobacterium]
MAKKSKGFRELLRERINLQEREENLQALQDQVYENSRKSKKKTVLVATQDGEKMSDILKRFVAPYIQDLDNFDEVEYYFNIAILAWNMTFTPEEKHQSLIQKFLRSTPPGDKDFQREVRQTIRELIERKKMYFSDVKRIITDFRLVETTNEYSLAVAYKMVDN